MQSCTASNYFEMTYHKGTSIRQEPEFGTSKHREKPMELDHLDECFVITLYVAGLILQVIV